MRGRDGGCRVPADHHAAAVPSAMLPEPSLLPDLTDDDIDAVAAEVLAARKGGALLRVTGDPPTIAALPLDCHHRST
jgi:hypothetical protein